jgi:protease PrsW
MVILAVSLAPVLFIFLFVYYKDKHEKEPMWLLIITFILGAMITCPVFVLQEELKMFTHLSPDSKDIYLVAYCLLIPAFVEETLKYTILRIFNYPLNEFDEPFDGIMYGVTVALGFAAFENILYVATNSLILGVFRMFTAVPAHAVCGAVMGYFVGKAKFRLSYGMGVKEHFYGLVCAILLHATFDFLLYSGIGIIAFLILLISGILVMYPELNFLARISPFRQQF